MALTCTSLKQGFSYRPETEDGLRSEHTEAEPLDQWQTEARKLWLHSAPWGPLHLLRLVATCPLRATRISSIGGLQSHGGHFRDSTDTLAASAVPWPGLCPSGLADPAEEQRTQKTGSLAGSARVACKPLLSQKSERSQAQPPPPMECVLKAHILLSSKNMSPRVGKSTTGAWSWAPHSPRDPAGTQLEPSLGLGDP